MDGTFGGGDLISASLAIMLGGGTDAELHEKSVFFSLAMITASETGIFEYDPQDEPPSGRPPGPWDGYNFFTVDLSTVKDNIEDMLARIAALEDELEDCHDCRDAVVAALQRYDPNYDPAEGECPSDKVDDVVDDVEACHDCKDAVVAAMQAIDPDYVLPASGCPDDIPQKAYDKGKDDAPEKYTFPEDDPINPDPDRYDNIVKIIGNDTLTDEDVHIYVKAMDVPDPNGHNVYYAFYNSTDNTYLDRTQAFSGSDDGDYVTGFRITNTATGDYEFYWVIPGNPPYYYTGTSSYLIGYGDPTHSYTVSKNN